MRLLFVHARAESYSVFFSRENIFTNFAALCLSAKKFFMKILIIST